MRGVRRWIAGVAAAATIGSGLAGCGSVAQGAVQALPAFLITDQQEYAIGHEAALEVVQQTPVYRDPTLQTYVGQLGQQAVQRSGRTDIPWHFTVLDQDEPDAFALPGGFIFLTTGIIRRMSDEAELAGVLSHEVGHVAAKHSVQMIRQAAVAQGIQTAVLGQQSQATALIANVVTTLVLRGYGRDKELEADRLGARYAVQNGYDPKALGDMLQTLESESGGTPAWLAPLSSHPTLSERLTGLDQTIASFGGGGGGATRTGSRGDANRFAQATASIRRR